MRFAIPLVLISALSVSGCTDSLSPSAIDQEMLCEVNEWRHDAVAAVCERGQKVVFLPRTFGNEQLPVIFAAVNCDMRYEVALTTGGVTCIYNPITPVEAEVDNSQAADEG